MRATTLYESTSRHVFAMSKVIVVPSVTGLKSRRNAAARSFSRSCPVAANSSFAVSSFIHPATGGYSSLGVELRISKFSRPHEFATTS